MRIEATAAGQGLERPAARPRAAGGSWRAFGAATAMVAGAAAAATAARDALHVPDVEMLFLLAVLLVALSSSRAAAVYASILSVVAYDYFFVPPALTLDVEDVRYLLTFAMMLGVGVVVSTLATRVRREQEAARRREQRTAALYAASRQLASALEEADVAAATANAALDALSAPAVFLAAAREDELAPVAAAPDGTTLSASELDVARWALLHGSPSGTGTGTFGDAGVLCVPLRPLVTALGVVAVRAGASFRAEQRDFLEALCRQAGVALERIRLGNEARVAARRADAEELRSTLLSSVSHDLRTPLAAITGAATTLRDAPGVDERTRAELVGAICDESARLERLVRNLLDMTRLQSGAVAPRREWVPLEEVVGGALDRVRDLLGGRRVTTAWPGDLPLLSADPVLVQQLLVNLLENAAKYTPAGSEISIAASAGAGYVHVEVADRGGGLPPGTEEQVFERFRRGEREAGAGFGLGLAIARAIAHAHGGTLTAANRPDGGAVFRLSLPVEPLPVPETPR